MQLSVPTLDPKAKLLYRTLLGQLASLNMDYILEDNIVLMLTSLNYIIVL